MNTLIEKPIAVKKAHRKDYSMAQVDTTMVVEYDKFIKSKSDLNNVTDLFIDNADFISHGISSMVNL